MAVITQTIVGATFFGTDPRWFWNSSVSTDANWLLNSAFIVDGEAAYFESIRFHSSGLVEFNIATAANLEGSDDVGPELVPLFESGGTITITDGTNTLVLNGITDTSEPYSWTPTDAGATYGSLVGAAAVTAFRTAVENAPNVDITLSFDDGGTVTEFDLSNFDTTNRDVDLAGVIETAARPGIYGIAPRAVSGSLLDGELGMSTSNEPITWLRFRDATSGSMGSERISINDNGSLALNTYFGAGGDGNDLIVHVQNADDEISFPVATNLGGFGGNYVIFNIPTEHQSFIAGIAEGDHIIFAMYREMAVVDTGVGLSGSATLPVPTTTGNISIQEAGSVSLSGSGVIPVPTVTGIISIEVVGGISLSGSGVVPTPSVTGRVSIQDVSSIALSGSVSISAPITSGIISIQTAGGISLRGSATLPVPTAIGTILIGSDAVAEIKRVALTVKHYMNVKDNMFNRIPRFYSESKVLNDIYSAIAPELENLLEFVVTPDFVVDNPDESIEEEINTYLDNKMGWGFERFINQFFVIAANHALGQFAQLYGTTTEQDYIRLRNKLLLYAGINKNINEFDLMQELNFIGEDIVSSTTIDYPNYEVDITFNPLSDVDRLAVAQRQFASILPAHMVVRTIQTALSLNSSPAGTINDDPKHGLS